MSDTPVIDIETNQEPSVDLLEAAWGIIANAGGGNWETQTDEWQVAATRWRDRYHAVLVAQRSVA